MGHRRRSDRHLHAYLRQAVLNRIRDELRRVRPHRVDGVALIADDSPTPLERAIGAEALERYERALLRLAEEMARA